MNGVKVSLPGFMTAAAMLHRTTEHLARELVEPSPSAPDWSETEWTVARAAATMQGISALLANRLEWSGPASWQVFLAEQLEQSRLRHTAIGHLLHAIDDATRRFGVGAIGLKGSALRTLGLYGSGERPMGDVDLLVSPEVRLSMGRILASIGYVAAFSSRRHDVFEPPVKSVVRAFGEHVDNPLKIEVHSEVSEVLPVSQVDITSLLRLPPQRRGLHTYPRLATLMLHLLLHAAGNMRANALRQIQIHDIAGLAGLLRDDDWRFLSEETRPREHWWLYPPLALTQRYYAGCIPPWVLRKAYANCPRALRVTTCWKRLSDVSWSNLRISAFPGIEWSRTLPEALQFIRNRLLPRAADLTELEVSVNTAPHLRQIPWYGISHGKRILKWIFLRPPRVQTMVSLRAAFNRRPPEDSGVPG